MKIQILLLATALIALPVSLFAQEKISDAAPRTSFDVPKTKGSTNEFFTFDGGNLHSFIQEIWKAYGVDLNSIGTIPPIRNTLQVPKMRLKRIPGEDFTAVLNLYNEISAESGESMGRWIIKRQAVNGVVNISALILTSPASQTSNQTSVKAFAVSHFEQDQLDLLRITIANASIRIAQLHSGNFSGDIQYHKETGIMIASGSPDYVNLAAVVINAYLEGHKTTEPQKDEKH